MKAIIVILGLVGVAFLGVLFTPWIHAAPASSPAVATVPAANPDCFTITTAWCVQCPTLNSNFCDAGSEFVSCLPTFTDACSGGKCAQVTTTTGTCQ